MIMFATGRLEDCTKLLILDESIDYHVVHLEPNTLQERQRTLFCNLVLNGSISGGSRKNSDEQSNMSEGTPTSSRMISRHPHIYMRQLTVVIDPCFARSASTIVAYQGSFVNGFIFPMDPCELATTEYGEKVIHREDKKLHNRRTPSHTRQTHL